jgi:hypothetical protein
MNTSLQNTQKAIKKQTTSVVPVSENLKKEEKPKKIEPKKRLFPSVNVMRRKVLLFLLQKEQKQIASLKRKKSQYAEFANLVKEIRTLREEQKNLSKASAEVIKNEYLKQYPKPH